ncbi:MAG: CRTAC1 family protein [Bacteriovoracia bacterium]
MKHFLVLLSLSALVLPAHGMEPKTKVNEAKKILKDLHTGTKFNETALKKFPQNFGGEARKLTVHQSKEYSAVALKMALADEAVFQNVMKDVFYPLEAMLKNSSLDFAKISEQNAQFQLNKLGAAKKVGEITQISWLKDSQKISPVLATEKLADHLKGFANLEYVKFSPFSTATSIAHRDPLTSLPNAFTVESRMDFRLVSAKGERVHERGVARIQVKRNLKSNQWLIESFEVLNGETLKSDKAAFREVASFKDGELSNHLRKEAIRRGGYAMAIGDVDGDEQADMIVGHLGAVEIFKGKSDGTFSKMSNQKLGIDNETLVKSAVIADFDNDGKKDILFVRFAPSEEKGKDIVLYKNNGASFQKVNAIKNRYPAYYAMPSAIADYNGDGMLDFYIGFPGAKDFTVLDKKVHGFEAKHELNPQGLFYNLGAMSFEEVTRQKMPYTKKKNAYTDGYPEAAAVFPHTSMGLDYDLDGDMDIVVVDDKANLSPLYKNNGDGTFAQVADKIGLTNYDFGMGFTASDLDNDSKLEFIYTNVNFLPAERLHNSLQANFSEHSKHPGTFGIRVFKSSNAVNYSDITALTGVNGCGDGIGGVEVIDYDNNGKPDIYVANGLWSGTHSDQDLSSLFVRANATYNYDFQEILGSSAGIEEANTSFMRILTGFQGEVETQVSKSGMYPSMAGFQRNCLFHNNGDGTFTEVGYLHGVDSMADGYVIGTADLNKDGKMDLVLRNGDPGVSQNRYPAVQVFLNQQKSKNKSVTVALVGIKSNKDAIGALLKATIDGKTLVRHLTANNGAVQSEAIVHFGLGDKTKIDELNITWPSGIVQKIKDVEAGHHRFVEIASDSKTAEK